MFKGTKQFIIIGSGSNLITNFHTTFDLPFVGICCAYMYKKDQDKTL